MSSESASGGKPRYLLDTSALLTFSGDEPGADAVGILLLKGRRGEIQLYLSFLSVMEAGYKAYQARGEDGLVTLLASVQQLPVTRVGVSDELIALAARMKGMYRLSLADAWVLATAKQLNATLVHKDPEFEQAATEVQLQPLPYR
ncbi:MAG: PIN domain-containing protein [Candidatus Omnitrophica bacterium]|nr:PIN domain-containing protein [Candidatus Omnitrophota bacterium]